MAQQQDGDDRQATSSRSQAQVALIAVGAAVLLVVAGLALLLPVRAEGADCGSVLLPDSSDVDEFEDEVVRQRQRIEEARADGLEITDPLVDEVERLTDEMETSIEEVRDACSTTRSDRRIIYLLALVPGIALVGAGIVQGRAGSG